MAVNVSWKKKRNNKTLQINNLTALQNQTQASNTEMPTLSPISPGQHTHFAGQKANI